MATLAPGPEYKPDNTISPDYGPGLPILLRFPPVLWLASLALSLLLQSYWPVRIAPGPWIRVAGVILVVVCFVFIVWARKTMVRAGTNVPPNMPALTVVMSGPFRYTRNPLYLGGTTAHLGLALFLNNLWLLILLVPVVATFHWAVVLREERYLESKFGETYTYKARVRRWL